MDVRISKELKRFNHLLGEIDAAYHDTAVRMGLSDSVMKVLYAICCSGERCALQTICRRSGSSKQTINSAIRKLEGEGMVRLKASGARSKDVCLTPAGKELAGRTAAPLIALEDEIFSDWSPDEVERYVRLTERYLTAFREKAGRFQKGGGTGRDGASGPGG